MRRILLQIFVPIFLLANSSFLLAQSGSHASAFNLRCEHLATPLGIDVDSPRLSWQMNDNRQGALQKSYCIRVDIDSMALTKGFGKLWDTGKVDHDKMLVVYSGLSLQPFTKYYWSVEIWDHDSMKTPPSISSFETGFLNSGKWRGFWISDGNNMDHKPAPYFRKVFETEKKIQSAKAYIAVAGLYELSVNGNRVDDHQLDPIYTRFDRRTLYVTHDVTKHLKDGQNAIGVLLGNGWYNHQSTAVWDFHEAPWRSRPAFCIDLRVTYEDGSLDIISSGTDWMTSSGPLIFNSIYTAEHYDARLEQTGWSTASFDDSSWKNAVLRTAPSQQIVAQAMHPIRNVEVIKTKKLAKINDTTFVYDIGRNISGVSKIVVEGPSGTKVRLKHGERLYENGRVDMSNIDVHYRPTDDSDPFQTDIFILAGKGKETFMPRFNYKGFQYVEVSSNRPLSLTEESLTAYFQHSDVPPVGTIKSSNPMINKLWEATNNSYLSNLFGYPTDCPQREKNGWTGDAHIAIETGLYNFDGITIYEKWLADHRDEQQPNGVLPAIIPTGGWGYTWANGPDWTSTIAIIPWTIYLFYGDSKLLADCYENIKRYVDYIDGISPSGLTTWGLGDWVPVKSKAPVEFTSSLYFLEDVKILVKAARLFGKEDDLTKYSALAKKIQESFNAKYLNRESGIYGSGLQTELSAALHWGVVPRELKATVAANLAKRVAADNYHLDVGLLGSKTILNALSENGYPDVAYCVAAQETFPSWGWWIVNGATTLYENWPIDAKSDISLNHIMFGEVGAWLYKAPGGIHPDPEHPGFKNVLLKPAFPEGLDFFEASYNSPYGKIISNWRKTRGKVNYQVTVPANSTASLLLPEGYSMDKSSEEKFLKLKSEDRVLILEAGTYVFNLMSKKVKGAQ